MSKHSQNLIGINTYIGEGRGAYLGPQGHSAASEKPAQEKYALTVRDLVSIGELDAQLTNPVKRDLKGLIRKIWDKFEENTKNCLDLFKANVMPFSADHIKKQEAPKKQIWLGFSKHPRAINPPTPKDTRPSNVGRFNDIELIRNTAIADPARTRENYRSEFLHANNLNFDGVCRFIAGQCPTPTELPGFWEMLAKNKVPLIVDLVASEQYENGGDLAGNEYSPGAFRDHDKNAKISAQCGVSCKKSFNEKLRDEGGNVIQYSPVAGQPPRDIVMKIEDIKIPKPGEAAHHMQRLHFPVWKDFGAVSPEALCALANKIESLNPDPQRPVHIHCRAGVGRTGTLISFMAARQHINAAIKKGDLCSIKLIFKTLLNVIAKGRIDRGPCFVQTPDQFALLVNSLMQEFSLQLNRSTPGLQNRPHPQPRSSLEINKGKQRGQVIELNDHNQYVNPKDNPFTLSMILDDRNHSPKRMVDPITGLLLSPEDSPEVRRKAAEIRENVNAIKEEHERIDRQWEKSVREKESHLNPIVSSEPDLHSLHDTVIEAVEKNADEISKLKAESASLRKQTEFLSAENLALNNQNQELHNQNQFLIQHDFENQKKMQSMQQHIQFMQQQMYDMEERLSQLAAEAITQKNKPSNTLNLQAQKKTSQKSTQH